MFKLRLIESKSFNYFIHFFVSLLSSRSIEERIPIPRESEEEKYFEKIPWESSIYEMMLLCVSTVVFNNDVDDETDEGFNDDTINAKISSLVFIISTVHLCFQLFMYIKHNLTSHHLVFFWSSHLLPLPLFFLSLCFVLKLRRLFNLWYCCVTCV